MRDAEPEDVQWNAQQLQNELDAFGRTAAYRALRAQDKRHIIEVRGEVGPPGRSSPPRRRTSCWPSMRGAGRLRALAVRGEPAAAAHLHDREVWAAVRRAAGARHGASVDAGSGRGREALAEAAASGQALYGRDADAGRLPAQGAQAPLATLTGPELRADPGAFAGLLAQPGT